jgi:predicted GIY-YIG superfamily endonuclease
MYKTMPSIPKKTVKNSVQMDILYDRELKKLRRIALVRSTAELGVINGLNTKQATELYQRIEHYRKTGEHLVKPSITVEGSYSDKGKVKAKPLVKPIAQTKISESDVKSSVLNEHLMRIRAAIDVYSVSDRTNTALKEGFVYIVTNPSYPGWFKIGMTVDFEQRLNSYNTGDPMRGYKFKAIRWTKNRRDAETEMLEVLKKLSTQYKGEWIKISEEVLFEKFNNLDI